MSKDLWTKAYEELLEKLGKEPTDRQITDRMAELLSYEYDKAQSQMEDK